MHKAYHKNKNKPHRPQFSTYTFLLRTNSQIVAHFQEMGYKVLVKKDVDRDLAVVIGILKVTEDLDVCEGIHHKGNHLQGKSHHLKDLFYTASPSHFLLLLPSGPHAHFLVLLHRPWHVLKILYGHNTPVNSFVPQHAKHRSKEVFLLSTALVHFHILLSYTIPCNGATLGKLSQQNLDSRQTISTPVISVCQAVTGELAQMASLVSDLTNHS